jgi:hypothetical protein
MCQQSNYEKTFRQFIIWHEHFKHCYLEQFQLGTKALVLMTSLVQQEGAAEGMVSMWTLQVEHSMVLCDLLVVRQTGVVLQVVL